MRHQPRVTLSTDHCISGMGHSAALSNKHDFSIPSYWRPPQSDLADFFLLYHCAPKCKDHFSYNDTAATVDRMSRTSRDTELLLFFAFLGPILARSRPRDKFFREMSYVLQCENSTNTCCANCRKVKTTPNFDSGRRRMLSTNVRLQVQQQCLLVYAAS